MNVSRSIDWRTMSLSMLDGHRFIARTVTNGTLDSTLEYIPYHWKGGTLVDRDHFTQVFHMGPDGHPRLNITRFKSINVLEEKP